MPKPTKVEDKDNAWHDNFMKNFKLPPVEVKHSELKLWSENSCYRRLCPCCQKGMLGMSRDWKTFALRKDDFCVECGQRVIYTDIKEVNAKEGRICE